MNRGIGDMLDDARDEVKALRAEVRRLKRLLKSGAGVALNLKACRYGRECPGCMERADAFIAALSRTPPPPTKRKTKRSKP